MVMAIAVLRSAPAGVSFPDLLFCLLEVLFGAVLGLREIQHAESLPCPFGVFLFLGPSP